MEMMASSIAKMVPILSRRTLDIIDPWEDKFTAALKRVKT
jgi:hypothetical protein